MQYVKSERKRETDREYDRRRREALRDAGLCYVCGINSTTTGRCDGCRKKQAERRNATAQSIKSKLRRQRRKELGLCERCDSAVVPGLTTCEQHRKIKHEKNRRYYKKVTGANKSPWFLSFNYETTPTVFEMGVEQ